MGWMQLSFFLSPSEKGLLSDEMGWKEMKGGEKYIIMEGGEYFYGKYISLPTREGELLSSHFTPPSHLKAALPLRGREIFFIIWEIISHRHLIWKAALPLGGREKNMFWGWNHEHLDERRDDMKYGCPSHLHSMCWPDHLEDIFMENIFLSPPERESCFHLISPHHLIWKQLFL